MAHNLVPNVVVTRRGQSSPQSSSDSEEVNTHDPACHVLCQSLKLEKRCPKYEDDNAGEIRSLLAVNDPLCPNYSGANQAGVPESETANPDEQSQPQSGNQSTDSTTDSTTNSTTESTRRFLSFVLFLSVLVLGIALVINSKIRAEPGDSREITPLVVNIYAMTLISIFGLWYGCDRLVNRKYDVKQSGSLIPRHLLNGLVLFGIGSSVCQVVTVLDFLKCQRHVGKLEYSCFVYPFFEMAFMCLQIYVFYALSTNSERKMLYGNAFTMFTLALNLTIWAKYFFASAVGSPEMVKEPWVAHNYYGVPDHDWCSGNATKAFSRKLHDFHSEMKPFMFTLTMEYALLASALLLHLWLEIATPNAGAFGATNSKQYKWQISRFGFIWGLFCLPVLGAIAVNASVQFDGDDTNKTKIVIIYVACLLLFVFLSSCSIVGLWYVKKFYIALDDKKPTRLDIILLCISWLGFLVYDLFTMFATCTEVAKNWNLSDFSLGVYALFELLTTGLLTTFLATAYSRKLPPTVDRECSQAAKYIRQIGSFCLIVSFGFWAMRTYTFRSKYNFDFVGNRYFKGFSWFIITQLSVPFCTFYHFHSAVCFTEVIAEATI